MAKEPRNKPHDEEWIRFNDVKFSVKVGMTCRFLHKAKKDSEPILHDGTINEIFHKNFMTFVRLTDLADKVDREILIGSIYEVKSDGHNSKA
jgi:hypothetical protein